MSADDKIEYLVDKITELNSIANHSSRKEEFMEKALEKFEENKH